jgi:HAE1 family hydrophobic/amphiphilic exporter-1
VAQTIVPMLAARFPAPPPITSSTVLGRLQDFYSRTLAVTLRHKWWTALAIVLVLASAAIPMMLVKSDMFPQGVGRNLFITYHLNGTYPLERVESAVSTVEAYLEKNRERFGIQTIYSYFRPEDAGTFVNLGPKGTGPETREVLDRMTEEMPEIIIGKPSFQFDQQAGEGFSLQLSGDSTEQLAELSFELARQLRAVAGLESVRSEARDGEEEIQIIVDRQRASQLGLTTGDVAASVAAAMRGDKLKEFRGTDREVDMRLTFRESDRQNVEDLATLPLYLPSGGRITLGAVADFRQVRGAREIKRVNRLTAVIVAGNLAKGATLDEIKKRVEPLMEQFAMPPGFTWKFGRGFETDDKTQQIMLQAILLGVAVIFLVMAALFESALHPLSILTSIIFAVVGMYWFFLITGTTMTFMSMVGLMILVGVVVNIGIVLVAHINNLRAAGLARDEAIIQAGRDRLRPILMTTMTTLLAMSALALGDAQVGGDGAGGGGPAYSPMARAIIGGLAFSSVLSLYAVPAFYEWFDDLNQWRRRIRGVARDRLVRHAAPLAAQRNST